MTLIKQIRQYRPYNEQEAMDQILILKSLEQVEGIFYREQQLTHMTASAWVVNPERTKVLMVYHKIYDSWSWMGGHADGEQNLLQVAINEVQEESGLKEIHPITKTIFSLESLAVKGHIKHGKYVSSHLHLNVTYLLEANESGQLSIKADENSGVAWFSLEDAVQASSEHWFREHIYSKLNEKLKIFADTCYA